MCCHMNCFRPSHRPVSSLALRSEDYSVSSYNPTASCWSSSTPRPCDRVSAKEAAAEAEYYCLAWGATPRHRWSTPAFWHAKRKEKEMKGKKIMLCLVPSAAINASHDSALLPMLAPPWPWQRPNQTGHQEQQKPRVMYCVCGEFGVVAVGVLYSTALERPVVVA